jgi:hypothetical protein
MEKFPNWAADACPPAVEFIKQIFESQKLIASYVGKDFQYTHILQSQLNATYDFWNESDALSNQSVATPFGPMNKPKKPLAYEVSFLRASVYDICKGQTLIESKKESGLRAVCRLLAGAEAGLSSGDCLVPFICYRSLLEQIGHFNSFVKEISALELESSFTSAAKYCSDLIEVSVPKVGATRVAWDKIARAQNLNELIEKNKIKYEVSDQRMSLESDSCLKSIDLVNKQLKGTRAIYEILCEFTHPNVGSTLISYSDAELEIGKDGVGRVTKALHMGPPFNFFSEMKPLVVQIFECISKNLSHYIRLLTESEKQANRAIQAAQIVAPVLLKRNKDVFDPYAVCPCGSGDKIRFCCGKR